MRAPGLNKHSLAAKSAALRLIFEHSVEPAIWFNIGSFVIRFLDEYVHIDGDDAFRVSVAVGRVLDLVFATVIFASSFEGQIILHIVTVIGQFLNMQNKVCIDR